MIEVDAQLRPLDIATGVVLAVCGALLTPRLGFAFAIFCGSPLALWLIRLSPLGARSSVRWWTLLMTACSAIVVVGGASLTGGADSPVMFFVGFVSLASHARFSHLVRSTLLGVGIIVAIVAVDLWLGRSIDPLIFLSALVIAGYLPLFVERMVRMEQAQRRRAVLDQLTGCLNRHALDARSTELEQQGERSGADLSVILFDLDHFKRVNDEFGHGVGDRVLAHVAYEARKHLRRFELVYRLGGEEFAILLPGAPLTVATDMAEKIRVAIETSDTSGIQHGIEVTASFGVATATSPFVVSNAIDVADRRMYAAKRRGRNCVVSHDIHDDRGVEVAPVG